MRIISRYLLAEFASASGLVFISLLITWVAADALRNIDLLASAPSAAFQQVLLGAVEMVPLAVPISCLAGIVWSLSRAIRYRELTAIRCGGIRLRSVLLPILVLAFLLGGALVLFEDRVLIPTRIALLAEEGDDPAGAERPPRYLNGRWWYSSGTSIFSAREYEAAEQTLHDVTVFKLNRQRQIEQRIDAERALNREGSTWEFHAARFLTFNGGHGLEHREVELLSLDLGLSGQDLARAGSPLAITTLHKLARRLREYRTGDSTLTELQVAFHARIAQPLAVLIFVLLAIPIAIGDVERADWLPRALLRSLAVSGVYWLMWTLALLAGRSGFVPAPFPIWGVTLLFLSLGVWRFRGVRE